MSPNDAEKIQNQNLLRQIYAKKYKKVKKQKPKYFLGEYVRLALPKTKFSRGYKPQFSQEIYQIIDVLDNLPIPRYQLMSKDDGLKLNRTSFEHELSHVIL